MDKEQLFKEISTALVDMDVKKTAELAKESLELNIPAYATITQGLVPGMDETLPQ